MQLGGKCLGAGKHVAGELLGFRRDFGTAKQLGEFGGFLIRCLQPFDGGEGRVAVLGFADNVVVLGKGGNLREVGETWILNGSLN